MYSNGRFLFGIGAGWHREETEIMGGDFAHRWTQTREAILAMKELWTKVESEYHGELLRLPAGLFLPSADAAPAPAGLSRRHGAQCVQARGGLWRRLDAEPRYPGAGEAGTRRHIDELAEAAGRDPSVHQCIGISGNRPTATS